MMNKLFKILLILLVLVSNSFSIFVPLTVKAATDIKQSDINKINNFITNDEGVKIAILGDSISSGFGDRGSVYGELGDKTTLEGIEKLALNILLYSSTYFLPLNNSVKKVYSIQEAGVFAFPWANSQIKVSDHESLTYTYPHKETKRDTLSIVYLKRYAATAPLFDIVSNGTTTTVDTYKPLQNFGSVTNVQQSGWDIAVQEISIPTDSDNFSFTLNNLRLLDRGSGLQADGTLVILGFYYGHAVDFKNLSVSSTSLLNNSSSNQTRGVTTDDRFQAAADFGTNVYFIAFGTNDSKAGVNTVEQFTSDLTNRISSIRTLNPSAVIFLETAPSGASGSAYENNVIYNQAIRDVATQQSVSLYDVETLLSTYNRADVIADNVHPNSTGYSVIGNTITSLLGFNSFAYTLPFMTGNENSIVGSFENIVGSSNIRRLSFFNEVLGTSITDKSSYGGNMSLSVDADALIPGTITNLRTLTFASSRTWQYSDSNELSFGDGLGSDHPFSIVWYGIPTTNSGYLLAKRDNTTSTANTEYQLLFSTGYAFVLFDKGGNTKYIGRKISTAPSYSLTSVIATYDGSKTSNGLKIYVNGVRSDDTNFSSGTYTGMSPGTAPVGNFRLNSGSPENISASKNALVSIVNEELNQTQVTQLQNAMENIAPIPVTTDNVDSSWHKTYSVVFTCSDGTGTDCAHTYYTTNGITPNTSSTEGKNFTLSTDGTYSIKYFSVGANGNSEIVKTSTNTVKIENVPPANIGISSIGVDSNSQLTITALAATDAKAGLSTTPYNFTETTGNPGGSSSDFQNSNIYIDTGLSPNTLYTYKVKARDAIGNISNDSDTLSKYTLADTPTNLSASSNSNSVTLSVDSLPNATSGQSGYYFSRSGANSGWIQTNSWTDTGLSCGHEYTYSVIYRNGDGTETSSISTTKSTNGCGGGGMPAGWSNLPITPTGGFKVLVNSGASTTSNRIVNLNFNAGSDVKKMAISLTGDFNDASQENYSPIKQIDLCSKFGVIKNQTCPDGTYKVYVKFYTYYGQSSGIASSTIVLKSGSTNSNIGIGQTPTTQTSPNIGQFTLVLKYGSNNTQVLWLQNLLNNLGFFPANVKPNGNFGPITKQAVQKFQCANKLVCSGNEKTTGYGQVGPKTRQVLNSQNH